ncbi:MAG: RagB/SusD family nutrient uptake outer membrane protein [Mangrovibacterium sp.]
MKTKIFIALMAALSLTSCENFLTIDPQDSLVIENYYTSADNVKANTASLYGSVWGSYHRTFMWLAGDLLAGDIYYTYDAEGQFYYNQVGAGNVHNNYGWQGLYRVISWSNAIINDMPDAARENGVDEQVIQEAIAEARLFRGLSYYMIAEYWGEAPIVENATATITSSNPEDIFLNRNTQSNLYQFACEDLKFASETLPETASQSGRVTKWSALGALSKVYITRGAYEQNTEYFTLAKEYARQVIEDSGLALYADYSSMFDIAANNSSESLIAIQMMCGNYGLGNSRNVNWSRSSRIADQTWGGGKGPSTSLQQQYLSATNQAKDVEDLVATDWNFADGRQQWVFMTHNNYYPNLNKADGGYTYQFVYRNPADLETTVESYNFNLAHIKKYVIGLAADNNGQVDLNQNAGNNLYLLRLSDVYYVYAEAVMGLNNSTSDEKAMGYINQVLERGKAGYTVSELTYEQLIKERRKEFAMEGINWFDIKRYYYHDETAALAYLNGMKRDRIYSWNWDWDTEHLNAPTEERYEAEQLRKNYAPTWETKVDPDDWKSDRVETIIFNNASMYLAIPAEETTKAPTLLEPAVDYYADKE